MGYRFSFPPLIEHSAVHVHLTDVLVGRGIGLQVDQDEAIEDVVIENEVDVIVLALGCDVILPADEGVSFAEFEQGFLQMIDDGRFELALVDFGLLRDAEEFENHRVLDKLFLALLIGDGGVVSLFDWLSGLDEAEVVLRLDVPLEDADAPAFREAFVLVPLPGLGVEDGDQEFVMGPAEQRRFSIRMENVWVELIKSIELVQTGFPKPLAKFQR